MLAKVKDTRAFRVAYDLLAAKDVSEVCFPCDSERINKNYHREQRGTDATMIRGIGVFCDMHK